MECAERLEFQAGNVYSCGTHLQDRSVGLWPVSSGAVSNIGYFKRPDLRRGGRTLQDVSDAHPRAGCRECERFLTAVERNPGLGTKGAAKLTIGRD